MLVSPPFQRIDLTSILSIQSYTFRLCIGVQLPHYMYTQVHNTEVRTDPSILQLSQIVFYLTKRITIHQLHCNQINQQVDSDSASALSLTFLPVYPFSSDTWPLPEMHSRCVGHNKSSAQDMQEKQINYKTIKRSIFRKWSLLHTDLLKPLAFVFV